MGLLRRIRRPAPTPLTGTPGRDSRAQCQRCGQWVVALPNSLPSWHGQVGKPGRKCPGAAGS